jgi:hypothetical protein
MMQDLFPHDSITENSVLLEYDNVSFGVQFLKFRRIIVP